ncbi:putative membrane protein YphA (DoxX/SURF4 family) [Lewinella aquimaris]|uniref:Putative membrane protein YphA (DoxX/SURF4 family) n=1 Tax=Neolewinella aquimaris TaxID=1835722 RepID=A0A840EAJ7_9BACT|nr:DoxX family protein [Neolewinella aquimaris]MBB4080575.1 putative membrane protein YphA (DoxX/SURF4 family) [Neolewinella aquimaris]
MDFPTVATYFSGLSFLFFGTSCLTSSYMKREFIRYGYDRQRPLVGVLQILGGAGLIVGYWIWPPLALASATGLFLMMAYGFGVRMKIGDSFLASTPAFLYAALNLYLAIHYGGS